MSTDPKSDENVALQEKWSKCKSDGIRNGARTRVDEALKMVAELEPALLRRMGLTMLVTGLILLWLVRRFFHEGP